MKWLRGIPGPAVLALLLALLGWLGDWFKGEEWLPIVLIVGDMVVKLVQFSMEPKTDGVVLRSADMTIRGSLFDRAPGWYRFLVGG